MKFLTALMATVLALGFGAPASAQDKYPSKPVKIIVPYAPGGATDITARMFGDQLKNILGQQFVVENKPGAFGILAIEEMARSQAGRLHADDRQRLDQRDHADHLSRRNSRSTSKRTWCRSPTGRHLSVVPDRDHDEFRRQDRQRPGRPRPRRIPARCATPAPASAASRTTTWKFRQARRRRHDPHSEQDRRRRHASTIWSVGDAQVAFLKSAIIGGDDQGRQAQADRGGRRAAAGGISRRADHGRGRLRRRRHVCTGRACWRRRRRRSRSSQTLFKAHPARRRSARAEGGVRQADSSASSRATRSPRRRLGSKANSTPGGRSPAK